ncbi:hypothetical protein DFAR_2910027 [Desulfarculales bacterium]
MLFEQAAMTLVREMPVLAAARTIGVSDTRLFRVAQFYVWPKACPKWTCRGQGRGSGRNRLQVGPQLRHHLHRPKPQAKAGHLRYPREGQELSGPVPPLPAGAWRRSQQYRRGSLRHVANLPGRQRRKLPQLQRHRGLIPWSPILHHRRGRGPKGRS